VDRFEVPVDSDAAHRLVGSLIDNMGAIGEIGCHVSPEGVGVGGVVEWDFIVAVNDHVETIGGCVVDRAFHAGELAGAISGVVPIRGGEIGPRRVGLGLPDVEKDHPHPIEPLGLHRSVIGMGLLLWGLIPDPRRPRAERSIGICAENFQRRAARVISIRNSGDDDAGAVRGERDGLSLGRMRQKKSNDKKSKIGRIKPKKRRTHIITVNLQE